MAINSSAQFEKLAHEVNASGSTLSFLHLSYRVDSNGREGKVLVDDVSVAVKAGELLAIMVGLILLRPYSLLIYRD
jgi:ABC-type glutathione transport system ATPase component